MKALVYGVCSELMNAPPALLSRAGFDVDAISTEKILKKHRFIKNFIKVDSLESLICKARDCSSQYDLLVGCDDAVIHAILNSSFTTEEKIRLLPVINEKYFSHLSSKTGLSKLLQKNNIETPEFYTAYNTIEMIQACEKIGFPVFVKIDLSSGGSGVYECRSIKECEALRCTYPVLVQKKIEGKLITSGGLFLNTKPIFFEIAEALICKPNEFGPSALRRYCTPSEKHAETYKQVCALGKAIGANGFVNLTWIESSDGKLYFIEADMRPNAWIEHAKYFQEDPAGKIKRYFKYGEILTESDFLKKYPETILAYAPRLRYHQMILNKFNCRDHYANYCDDYYLLKRGIRAAKSTVAIRVHRVLIKAVRKLEVFI